MELERDTFERLVQYLRDHGYPESSFGFNYPAGKRQIDLVILDEKTGLPISLFEVKASGAMHDVELARKQIAAFLEELPDKSIPTFLVFPKPSPPGFSVERIDVSGGVGASRWEVAWSESYSNFAATRRAQISKKADDAKKKKEESVEHLQRASWVIAFVVFVLAALNRSRVLVLDGTDLALLGAVVGLVLLPFASKVKFFGVEFERLRDARKD